MDHAETVVAVADRVHNYAHGIYIVYFFKGFSLHIHFAVYSVDGLYSSLYNRVAYDLFDTGAYFSLNAVQKLLTHRLLFGKRLFNFSVGNRVEVAYREILKLLLHGTDTEAVRYRGIYLDGFTRGVAPLLLRHEFKRAHIVQTVGKLNDYHADILTHCKQELAKVFRLLLLLARKRDFAELCHAVNEQRNACAEILFYIVFRHRSVLHRVVKESRFDALCVHSEADENVGDRNGVDYIRLARLSPLTGVRPESKFKCALYGGCVRRRISLGNLIGYRLVIYISVTHLGHLRSFRLNIPCGAEFRSARDRPFCPFSPCADRRRTAI